MSDAIEAAAQTDDLNDPAPGSGVRETPLISQGLREFKRSRARFRRFVVGAVHLGYFDLLAVEHGEQRAD